jgi:hypothetical protein
VSSHFFDARRKKHRLSTISFCYGKETCGCKQTGKERWDMLLRQIPQRLHKQEISFKLKVKHVKVAKVSSNVSEIQLFKVKLTLT